MWVVDLCLLGREWGERYLRIHGAQAAASRTGAMERTSEGESEVFIFLALSLWRWCDGGDGRSRKCGLGFTEGECQFHFSVVKLEAEFLDLPVPLTLKKDGVCWTGWSH
jgi:hypothetical protein